MSVIAPHIKHQFFDLNGNPLNGGKLETFSAGTTTPLATFTDATGLTANPNPIILDSRGEALIYLTVGVSYKFVLKDSLDNLIYTVDLLSPSGIGFSTWNPHAVTDGQAATNLVGETVDSADFSSAYYEYEILRGTTVFTNGRLALQRLNSVWRIVTGGNIADEKSGVTFTITESSGIVQLLAALDSGAGDGTIKLRRSLVPK